MNEIKPFEWQRLILGDGTSWAFLLEVGFRTFIMYLVLLAFFRLSGRREIRQLSIFDLIIIVGLGSAAGDPMFYDDVALLPALTVFLVILAMYKFISYLGDKNPKLENWLQGEPVCILDEKGFYAHELESRGMDREDLFAQLRLQNVEHLGQVRRVYLEASGQFSLFFQPDEAVTPGLPTWPEVLESALKHIDAAGTFSCCHCGHTVHFPAPKAQPLCDRCGGLHWVPSQSTLRVK
ncbi:DUF421 domain-containing protein [Rhabdobacter roseus]|uniref:Uncharacterized membrane protein YcaP (DUF421 family) n=1 Tax=Rhabdobacter roseus TaxID=1655419 RepID=A0A840TYK1_9BACT|nr:YetF domain-containing protein [Rhabdobacter roseus]MBB5286692.1 uncharacterized membrane protein YcaP (DUF421 family) [Rhabdobacter roseus]